MPPHELLEALKTAKVNADRYAETHAGIKTGKGVFGEGRRRADASRSIVAFLRPAINTLLGCAPASTNDYARLVYLQGGRSVHGWVSSFSLSYLVDIG